MDKSVEALGVLLPTQSPLPHPGEMLREEFLAFANVDAQGLAERIKVPLAVAEELLAEKRGVDADMALRLHRLTGTTAAFWLNLQASWDLWQALRESEEDFEGIERLNLAPATPA